MPSLGVIPFEFWDELISPETRMMGLPYGEEIRIVGRTMWTQSTSVTDGQSDGQNYDHKDRATHDNGVSNVD